MAFSAVPTSWIADWSEDGTDITVPLASFPELTAAEADGTTGDIRKIAFAVLEKLFQEWISRDSADRPAMWTAAKTVSVNTSTGVSTAQYVMTFKLETTAQDVADEA